MADAAPAKNFITGAIKRPGALTRKAKAAGLSTGAFARKHEHDKGLTGQQARFANVLRTIGHGRK